MSRVPRGNQIPFAPAFSHKDTAAKFRAIAGDLPRIDQVTSPISHVEVLQTSWDPRIGMVRSVDESMWRASTALLADFWLQGWQITVTEQQVFLRRPEGLTGEQERVRRQVQLSVRRQEQLSKDSVRRFISKMESPGSGSGSATIRDLLTDGESLAESLCRPADSSGLYPVQPYIQPVVSGSRCEYTGFLLTDIWRYFRHTWTSPYESVPGRSLLLLIRDAARPMHSIIGIAALSSAAVKQQRRDQYIGWTANGVQELIRSYPRRRWKHWLERSLRDFWDEVYKQDLLGDGLLDTAQLTNVSDTLISSLRAEATKCREQHQAQPHRAEFGTSLPEDEDEWVRRAKSPLFRSKRCEKLAMLLQLWKSHIRLAENRSKRYASQLLESQAGQTLIDQTVRLAKARLVGTAIADLSVCGAIPPYNELVGGKLVALLAASEAARQAYRDRYSDQPSIIASSMAGRRVVRPADLVFVGTSSLYGIRPNQYDSLSMPVSDDASGGLRLRYKHLGKSEGYGSAHIRQRTKARLQEYMAADGRSGWRANNIFGEGANPNMRALREAFGEMGLDANELLQHSQPREMYGAVLASNVTEYVLGLDRRPEYIKRGYSRGDDVEAIADFWWERWAGKRSKSDRVLERIRAHSLAFPVRHDGYLGIADDDASSTSMFADL